LAPAARQEPSRGRRLWGWPTHAKSTLDLLGQGVHLQDLPGWSVQRPPGPEALAEHLCQEPEPTKQLALDQGSGVGPGQVHLPELRSEIRAGGRPPGFGCQGRLLGAGQPLDTMCSLPQVQDKEVRLPLIAPHPPSGLVRLLQPTSSLVGEVFPR
jgi:hypothetical protein